jgi:glutamate-5-semialdehyde dehydrogenase
MSPLASSIIDLCAEAKAASRFLAKASPAQIQAALAAIADALLRRSADIYAANQDDLRLAEHQGLSVAMVDRLRVTEKTLEAMIEGVRQVIALPDPLAAVLREWTRPNGLAFQKIRVPIGVIGIIYESRPNVTIDAAVLCLKAGNAVILRGGSEAFATNQILAEVLKEGLLAGGLPAAAAQLVPTTDRAAIPLLCAQDKFIDLLIPRGGHGLIESVVEHARMPVIKHYHGVCHLYVHQEADPDLAEKVILNAKCQKPGVCNALETLLVDRAIAETFLPRIVAALHEAGVEIRGDSLTQRIGGSRVQAATVADWTTEYLALILSVRVVDDFAQAVTHLETYGSAHSDGIITRNEAIAHRFFREVDSATVFWNASTRFNDGFEFGFGAEIGISTDKLHARGPMGLEELTSYKYLITGQGQVRG